MNTNDPKDDEISPALKAHLDMMKNAIISSLSSEIKSISEEVIPMIDKKINDINERVDKIDETLQANKEVSETFNGRITKTEEEIESLEARVSTIH